MSDQPVPVPRPIGGVKPPTPRERFDAVIPALLKFEDDRFPDNPRLVNHPQDTGRHTFVGVTAATYMAYEGLTEDTFDPSDMVRDLTANGFKKLYDIYFEEYFTKVSGDKLPPGLLEAVLDFAIHSSPDRAIRYLQRALGVTPDSIFGPITEGALMKVYMSVEAYNDMVDDYLNERLDFLRNLTKYKAFGPGWENRLAKLKSLVFGAIADAGKNPLKEPVRVIDATEDILDGVLDVLEGKTPENSEGYDIGHVVGPDGVAVPYRKPKMGRLTRWGRLAFRIWNRASNVGIAPTTYIATNAQAPHPNVDNLQVATAKVQPEDPDWLITALNNKNINRGILGDMGFVQTVMTADEPRPMPAARMKPWDWMSYGIDLIEPRRGAVVVWTKDTEVGPVMMSGLLTDWNGATFQAIDDEGRMYRDQKQDIRAMRWPKRKIDSSTVNVANAGIVLPATGVILPVILDGLGGLIGGYGELGPILDQLSQTTTLPEPVKYGLMLVIIGSAWWIKRERTKKLQQRGI